MINVLTPAYVKNLVSVKKIDPKKIIMIPNGADFTLSDNLLEGFDACSFKSDLGVSDKFVIIYVGAHGLANHLIQLLDAAEILCDTRAHFLLLGDGMEKPMLVEEARKRQLRNLTFIDPVPKQEVFKYILASDIGTAVLKQTDTFKTIYSNKTFDYMACQKPVIAAIDGVTRELIEKAECGRFVEPENPVQLSKAVQYYMDHPELVKQQGLNGYEHAKRNYDREKLATEYLRNLEALIH